MKKVYMVIPKSYAHQTRLYETKELAEEAIRTTYSNLDKDGLKECIIRECIVYNHPEHL